MCRLNEAALANLLASEDARLQVLVSRQRDAAGRAAYYEVLQQQQQLFPAENLLAQTELNQYLAVIQLYRALAGGWNAPLSP